MNLEAPSLCYIIIPGPPSQSSHPVNIGGIRQMGDNGSQDDTLASGLDECWGSLAADGGLRVSKFSDPESSKQHMANIV